MTKLGIYGSLGRMGQAIANVAPEEGAMICGGADIGDDPLELAKQCDVLVDFSAAPAIEAHLAAARAAKTPIVIGTTGLTSAHQAAIDAAAGEIGVLQTGNTSLGIALLAKLVREAAQRLGTDWDIEIVEMHHRNKVDAPSGTALMLGEAAAGGIGSTFTEAGVIGRAGLTGARASGTVGLASLRGGSVVGDHSVVFAGNGERIELTHRADDRAIFARGAVRAAMWLAKQPAGRYDMGAVLGL
ncbi:4-hydroxy-tetrahydrodipicolinate reductase [Stakelama tenebrarum]|uniref:4-hydroxy-tetrahydrodipicolinate reductase n=1 Tax=Stakelama tenebrarum TaxID=2711215 RepID=A0A6G6YAB3_9SPHN|nr:4-hydroxy-tetrahydrodipicolinate reductase [Sphingosinithalassobacter tenebrarum]QIG81513.1 4-hydroxy-tetrahydrodipicolinate reductase [Sphingosinithalassobacter tenebrarum]